MVVTN
jgi:predicted GTPase